MMIGERLSDLRKDRGLTQKQLSDALGVNFRTYSGYEREESEASDEIKIKIARYFNVSVDYLLGLIEQPHPIGIGSEYLRLPFQFGEDARKDLNKYIDFLSQREKDGKGK